MARLIEWTPAGEILPAQWAQIDLGHFKVGEYSGAIRVARAEPKHLDTLRGVPPIGASRVLPANDERIAPLRGPSHIHASFRKAKSFGSFPLNPLWSNAILHVHIA